MDTPAAEPEAPAVDPTPLLLAMVVMETSMPTIHQVVAAAPGGEPHAEATLAMLEAAVESGLVDAVEDWGADVVFTLSPLGAERMKVRPTFDSRRWQDARSGRLLGPHDDDGRYRNRRRDTSEDLSVPLHRKVDPRQPDPHDVLAAAEEAAREAARKPYSSDNPPYIRRFYGLGAIWAGEEQIKGKCPYCRAEEMGIDGYCTKCHRSGMDAILPKPEKSRRRQMPASTSSLRGGV